MQLFTLLYAISLATGQIPADCDAATRLEYVKACHRAYPRDEYGWGIKTLHNLACCLQDEEPFEECVAQCEFGIKFRMDEDLKSCTDNCAMRASPKAFGLDLSIPADVLQRVNADRIEVIKVCQQNCHTMHQDAKTAMIKRCKEREEKYALADAQQAHNNQHQKEKQRASRQNRLMTLRNKPK